MASVRRRFSEWTADLILETNRPMKAAERATLSACIADKTPFISLRETVKWFSVWLTGLCLSGLLLVAIIARELNPILTGLLCGPIFVISIVCLYSVIQHWTSYFHRASVDQQFRTVDLPELKRALDDGVVDVKNVKAQSVIKLIEFEDEGGGYVFDIGNGQLLFLKGQHIYPVEDTMMWPNSHFEIVRTNVGKRWVGIFCYGSELSPVRTIELSNCREDVIWDNREEVITADLQRFASSLLADL